MLDLSSTDGFYSHVIHRPIARHVLRVVPLGASANMITLYALLAGFAGSAFSFYGHDIFAVVFIQIYCVFSCLDGEVARRSGVGSQLGDFYDTVVDRVVEVMLLLVIVSRLNSGAGWSRETIYLDNLCIPAVYLLAYTSEKYRSSFKKHFPKSHEGVFRYFSSGFDARMSMYCLILIMLSFFGPTELPHWLFRIVILVIVANLLLRLFIVRRSACLASSVVSPLARSGELG